MRTRKLVIFDLDGTLLNTVDDLGNAVNHALAINDFPEHPLEAYPLMVGNGVRRLVERAVPSENRSDATINMLLSDFHDFYDDHLSDLTRPYDGIHSLLRELRNRGINVAVASNKYESAVKKLMAHFFADIDFASVCGHLEGNPPKPDPSVVFRVLNECPTPKAEVLYVGDSAIDIETARRACVDSVGVTWGFRPRSELTSAYANEIIDSPEQLLELL